MNSADSQSRNTKSGLWLFSLAGIVLAAAFLYFWVLPLFRPRGDFLWGHYRLKDIYFGIPIALIALDAMLVLAVPARYRRSLSLRLTTLLMSILLALAVCDAGYAFAVMNVGRPDYWLDQGHISRRYSIADPELGFVRKPGVAWRGYIPELGGIVEYQTDENGFRNAPGQQQADIVFIGDSYTEAAQIKESDTLVRRVAQLSGRSVVNLARGAYGPRQELIVLQRYGLAYKPRVVVWQLFEGNDLNDAEAFAKWQQNPQIVNSSLKQRYFDNSLLKELLIGTREQEYRGPTVTLRYHDGTARRMTLRYPYEPDQPATMSLGMTETLSALEAGRRLCESKGIRLVVVVVPTMVHVMAPDITFDRAEDQRKYLPEARENQKDFSATIKEFCARTGCTVVDGFEALRRAAAADNRHLYIPNDEHFDVRGHSVLAQTVVDSL
jgi:hypothetical protein